MYNIEMYHYHTLPVVELIMLQKKVKVVQGCNLTWSIFRIFNNFCYSFWSCWTWKVAHIPFLYALKHLGIQWPSDAGRWKTLGVPLKVSKSRKQNTKISNTPKNQRNFVHSFALASKKWLKTKIIALDNLN